MNENTEPFSSDEWGVLQNRARRLAVQGVAQESAGRGDFYLLIQLGKSEQYAIAYSFLDEVIPPQRLMKVPGVHECFAGAFNYRGLMMTAVDMRRYLGIPQSRPLDACQLAIIHTQSLRIALLVDDIIGNRELHPDALKPGLHENDAAAFRCVKGLFQGNIALLDPEIMVSDPIFHAHKVQWFQQS
ncbi:MAG: chemotaxis protein CheW [Methylococcaceae bacterium]|nr:MAG: chemotaxis protein CheW [Methylococcaceae bacterium]